MQIQERDLTDDFSILLLEESPTLQALFDDWIPDVPTRIASTPSDIPAQFDSTVAVACLSQSALGDMDEAVRKQILTQNPYCQLVTILPRSSFLSIYENDYDACLQRPIFEDEFQQTITHRFKCGVFSALLRKFYDLNTKLLWLRRGEIPEDTLENVDRKELLEKHGSIISKLSYLRDELSDKDIRDISQSIDLHKRYLKAPARDVDKGIESKYHPPRCPNCKLPWGVNHGNELGKGMVSIGAGVWRCTRCTEILHGLGEAGRRIMRG